MAEYEKKRDTNATEEQKEILVSFMEDNDIDFGKGKFVDSVEGKKKYNSLWDVLRQSLNSAKGPTRDTAKWQRFWSDMKTRTKRKAAEIKKSRGATGCGSESNKFLTPFEKRVLFFISPEAGYGVADPEMGKPDVGLESDAPPVKRPRQEYNVKQYVKEEPELILTDLSEPNSPASSVEMETIDLSPSTSQQRSTPSSRKRKVISSCDVQQLVQQQISLNHKLDKLSSTLETNLKGINEKLERIAMALEKRSS